MESLAALGLVLQLGHAVGEKCPHPSRHHQLTIFDLNGVHQVIIRYCVCSPEDPAYRRRQLLRMMWFPATLVQPHTVFTFHLLDFFHQLQSHNKTNLYNFYNTIVRLSNNAGLSPEIVSPKGPIFYLFAQPIIQHRYNEISLVYRMWVHLHILKRGGAAYHPGGADSLPDGSMAVECPACPHPGRNIDAQALAEE